MMVWVVAVAIATEMQMMTEMVLVQAGVPKPLMRHSRPLPGIQWMSIKEESAQAKANWF